MFTFVVTEELFFGIDFQSCLHGAEDYIIEFNEVIAPVIFGFQKHAIQVLLDVFKTME